MNAKIKMTISVTGATQRPNVDINTGLAVNLIFFYPSRDSF
jgi:hypothetical protein